MDVDYPWTLNILTNNNNPPSFAIVMIGIIRYILSLHFILYMYYFFSPSKNIFPFRSSKLVCTFIIGQGDQVRANPIYIRYDFLYQLSIFLGRLSISFVLPIYQSISNYKISSLYLQHNHPSPFPSFLRVLLFILASSK